MFYKILKIFIHWIPLAVVISLICFIIYIVIQQNIRLGANYPQIQMAEDAVAALAKGDTINSLGLEKKVDMAASLSPYLIIFNEQGAPIAASVELDGQTPIPPEEVFEYTKNNREDRLTWQPESGVRNAAVMVYFSGKASGYVLAGRSLREAEKLIDQVGQLVLLGWLGSLLITLFTIFVTVYINEKFISKQKKI